MPTLITRCGCRSRAPACSKASSPMSASTTASRGSPSRASEVTRVKRWRMVSTVTASTSATTACGLPGSAAAMARSSASWSLASARRGRPALAREARLDAVGPAVGRAVVVDDHGHQPVEAEPARERDGLVVGALCELAVAEHAEHARLLPAERPQRQRAAHGDRQPVAERAARDLDAGDQRAVGVVTERRVEAPEAGQRLDRHEALGGEHGVVRSGPVPLGEQEAVALRGRRRSRA